MPCYSPLVAYWSKYVNPTGKRSLVWNVKDALSPVIQQVPCGKCIGCKLEKSRQWAIRCSHESSLWSANCFITLTYEDDALPKNGSLVKEDLQLFWKRLRERVEGIDYSFESFFEKNPRPIRYYACGEYGEKLRRPHYHSIVFNYDFPDRVFWKTYRGNPLFLSPLLQSLWPFGYSVIGAATFDTAAYIARYVLKKITGDMAEEHYRYYDWENGEVHDLEPEYNVMSRRPGIARAWYERFHDDVYPEDLVVIGGRRSKPPKYYDTLYELNDLEGYQRLKYNRRINSLKHIDNNSYDRLIVKEKVQLARLKMLTRSLE